MASSPPVAPPRPHERQAEPVALTRRRWPKRLLIGLNVFLALCLLGAGSLYAYTTWRFNQINRASVAGLVGEDAGQPQTILLVGSDTRSFEKTSQDKKSFGTGAAVAGQRSDTIILVHLDPRANPPQASLLSIPRDLFVPIPGTNGSDRINSTFDKGPDLLVRTIHDDLGIEINHYVELDFASFKGVVNSVGAVHIYFPTPAKDAYSGLNIVNPGCIALGGDGALSYVRSRHYEYYQNGRWHFEGESDLARIRRQQDFIKKMMGKAIDAGLNNPVKLNGVVGALVNNLTVDSDFHESDMVRLAKRFKDFSPDALQNATIPTIPKVVTLGGAPADILALQQPQAKTAIDQFLGTPASDSGASSGSSPALPAPTNINPADVQVKVLNGSGRSGQAASVASSLRHSGFVVTGTDRADSYRYITPVVRYANGQEAKARFLQSLVIGGAQVQPDPTLTGTDVVLITGSSYSGLHPASTVLGTAAAAPVSPAAASSTAPTTVPAVAPAQKAALPGMPAGGPPVPCAA